MSTARIHADQSPPVAIYHPDCQRLDDRRVFECEVVLEPPEHGLIAVYAAKLPGAVSQGATEQEALVNIHEALTALFATYDQTHGGIPPWTENIEDVPPGSCRRWIAVDADA